MNTHLKNKKMAIFLWRRARGRTRENYLLWEAIVWTWVTTLGLHKLLETKAVDVVEQTEVDIADLERLEIEAVEDTRLGQGEESLELRELDQGLDVKVVALEEVPELVGNVKVVDRAELAEEARDPVG